MTVMTMAKKMIAAVTLMGALTIALVLTSPTQRAWAQDSVGAAKAVERETSKPVEAYRLDFSINELEDGKKINSRQYSMNLTANQPQEIKIGTRVPVENVNRQGETQYLDVGTNISGRLQNHNGQLELFVNTDMSNFAIPEQAAGHEAHPVIRQLKIGGSTLVVLGTPMVIGSADDPNSKRQFEVVVTMTKLR
jgi:3D (Asp-Asp-Asp) domain-containing protein